MNQQKAVCPHDTGPPSPGDEALTHTAVWVGPEHMLSSGQAQKDTYCWILLRWSIWNRKSRGRKYSSGCWGLAEGRNRE